MTVIETRSKENSMGSMEKQNHEDDPRGSCFILERITPYGVTRLFLLRGLLGLLGRGFLFCWHGRITFLSVYE